MASNIYIKSIGNRSPLFFLVMVFIGCFGAGTLGGFDTIVFPVNKRILVSAFDSLYLNYPKYKIQDKWKQFDSWSERGYGFLDSRLFYFESDPEEMYYVTFLGDSIVQSNPNQIKIAVRAVWQDESNWKLEKNCSSPEKGRIAKRFNQEIILKLEKYTNSKARTEN